MSKNITFIGLNQANIEAATCSRANLKGWTQELNTGIMFTFLTLVLKWLNLSFKKNKLLNTFLRAAATYLRRCNWWRRLKKKKILWRCKRFDASDQNKDGGVLTYAGTSRCSNDAKKLRTCKFPVKYSRGVVSTMQRPGGEVWTNHLKSIVLSNSINYIMTSPLLLPSASLPGFPIPNPLQLAVLKVNCIRVSTDTPVFRKREPVNNVTKAG